MLPQILLVSMIKKPSIIVSANNSIDFNNSITISKYEKNPLYLGVKTNVSVMVALDSNFTTVVYNKKVFR